MKNWLINTYDNIVFWWVDKPYLKLWRAISERVEAVAFCLILLFLAIYSPKLLRHVILESTKDRK